MSSTRVAAAAQRIGTDEATFASLPLPLARRIFLALPVNARGRASCVCRAWRDVLDDPSLWTRLVISAVPHALTEAEWQRFLAVLRGAASRARGHLRDLDLGGKRVNLDVLLPVLTANADSLRELHLGHDVRLSDVGVHMHEYPLLDAAAIVAAAPLLQVLTVEDLACSWEEASRVLRTEPPFAPLQLGKPHSLIVHFEGRHRLGGMERFAPFAAALADAASQPALVRLSIWHADTAQPALMGALVDAAVARRLLDLTFDSCTPPAAAQLARLLVQGSLTAFTVYSPWSLEEGVGTPLFDAAGGALVADALRVNTTLTTLDLTYDCFLDMGAARALVDALVGHPSLRSLGIHCKRAAADERIAYGAALGALIAADAPALHGLVCCFNHLGDAGLAPIVEALPLNRHLRYLNLRDNDMREAFAREQLLPAVRANTTLLGIWCADHQWPRAAAEAEDIVRRRGQHD
jgi:hypothetical protein